MAQQLSTNTFIAAKWVVDPSLQYGTHTTISGANAAASSGDTILIRPGTYTENFAAKKGVSYVAWGTADYTAVAATTPPVQIIGKITLAAGGTGNVMFSGLYLQTNGDYFFDVTNAGITHLVTFFNCYFNCLNFTGMNLSSTGGVPQFHFQYCKGDIGAAGLGLWVSTVVNNGIVMSYCEFTNAGASTTANSTGILQASYCKFANGFSFTDSQAFNMNHCQITTPNAVALAMTAGDGSQPASFYKCDINSGTSTAITVGAAATVPFYDGTITSSNAAIVSGAGTIQYSPIACPSGSTLTTTTQTPVDFGPRVQLGDGVLGAGGAQVMSGTGDPNATVTAPQGSLYLRRNGGVGTLFYVNSDGVTAWTAY